MQTRLTRSEFTRQASAGLCGLVVGGLSGADAEPGKAPASQEKRLLQLGLNGLARAHGMNYFADGHRAAAMIAAHLLCTENALSDAVSTRIEQLFDLNWAHSPLCAPFPEEDPDPAQINRIGEVLSESAGSLREVGHNTIFAMHALRGFRLMPELATPKRIDGVCKLIRAIKPWRDDVRPDEDSAPSSFADSEAAATFVLREASAAIDRWAEHGQGFSGHLITFGQSLVELAAMGDNEWAESCRIAFCKYLSITRRGPGPDDAKRPAHKRTAMRPSGEKYWQMRGDRQVDIGHAFKYPYSYYDLMRRVKDDALKQEIEQKIWRVF